MYVVCYIHVHVYAQIHVVVCAYIKDLESGAYEPPEFYTRIIEICSLRCKHL